MLMNWSVYMSLTWIWDDEVHLFYDELSPIAKFETRLHRVCEKLCSIKPATDTPFRESSNSSFLLWSWAETNGDSYIPRKERTSFPVFLEHWLHQRIGQASGGTQLNELNSSFSYAHKELASGLSSHLASCHHLDHFRQKQRQKDCLPNCFAQPS
jgi:hypothetical protein